MDINPNEDTEFNDALRKYGILPPRPPTPRSPSPPPSPDLDDLLNDLTSSELQELSEDVPDGETERMIAAFRRQRLADERKADKRARFGRVYPIGRDDYTREVTEASQINEDGDEEESGTGVVCFLYKDGIIRSDRAKEHVHQLALRYPRTKFVSIVGDKCIPNLPDSQVPMFIVYKKGEIRNQVIAWGADKERRLEELEATLLVTGALHFPDQPQPRGQRKRDDEEDEDEDEDENRDRASKLRPGFTSTQSRPQRNIRSNTKKKGDHQDSDSDFEFDL